MLFSRRLIRLLGPVLLLPLVAVSVAPAEAAEARVTISGVVTDSEGAPIEGVSVTPWNSDDIDGRNVFTRPDGSFTLSLMAGTYRLEFDGAGDGEVSWAREFYDDKPDLASATPITLAAGQVKSGLAVELASGGSITGTVAPEGDVDPSESYVLVYPADHVPDYSEVPMATAYPDEDGLYQVDGLPAGTYRVRIGAYDERLVGRYVGGSSRFADARDVHVDAGGSTDVGSTTLPLGGTISGTLTEGPSRTPAANRSVTLEGEGDVEDFDYSSLYTTTNAKGRWKVRGVDAQRYTAQFEGGNGYAPEFYDSAYDASSATRIGGVLGQPVAGIDANLEKRGTITGRVTFPAGAADPWSRSILVIADSGEPVGYGWVATDGTYSVKAPPGRYRVQFAAAQGPAKAASQYYRGHPDSDASNAERIVVKSGKSTPLLNTTLKVGGTMSGRLLTAAGKPLTCEVFAYAPGAALQGRSARTKSDGSFTVPGLSAGQYRIVVNEKNSPCLEGAGQRFYDVDAASRTTAVEADGDAVPTTLGGSVKVGSLYFGDLQAFDSVPTPTISGTAKVGQTLTAAPGDTVPSGSTATYQWRRGSAAITGATKATYKLVAADKGKKVSVVVTYRQTGFVPESATSATLLVG